MTTTWTQPINLAHTAPTEATVLDTIELFGVEIPAGYCTDGASAPRLFYNIIARFTDALPAALVHDARYDPPADRDGSKQRWLTRAQADREFYDNLRASGVSRRRAWAAYLAVRTAGGWHKRFEARALGHHRYGVSFEPGPAGDYLLWAETAADGLLDGDPILHIAFEAEHANPRANPGAKP